MLCHATSLSSGALMQRLARFGPMAMSAGSWVRQALSTNGQRSAKRQPVCGRLISGTAPSMAASRSARRSSRGSEPSRPMVLAGRGQSRCVARVALRAARAVTAAARRRPRPSACAPQSASRHPRWPLPCRGPAAIHGGCAAANGRHANQTAAAPSLGTAEVGSLQPQPDRYYYSQYYYRYD